MSSDDLGKLLATQPVDGATVRTRRKWMILKFVARFPEGVHEETICAALDMITGLTHYRIKVYIHELDRGSYVHRKENGMVRLTESLDSIYARIVRMDSHAELPP